ncbi:PHD finger protein 7-like [Motacilla alba alba]|uniref:PHD finger protein 7-like n=1 Tax=Motacilla alba alba TaxID=1094192 RepID=UPI0018D51270|nr:PHD finger protein 7-like [Motacilla alba alba]
MCDRKQEGPGAREPARRGQSSPWGRCCCRLRAPQRCSCPLPLALSPAACVLCRRAEADPDICGDKLEKCGLCAHFFCMFFCTLLFRHESNRVGLMGFLPRDIQIAVSRAAHQHCCICGQSGATIMCCKEDCGRWFHLPCAKEGGCVNIYISPYSSFCPEHRPEQDVEATPEPGTDCLICMEPVEDRKTFTTLVCPTCRRAWFHRDCIQGQAMHAGLLCLQCPLCREGQEFIVEMLVLGIRIPIRCVSFCLAHETGGCKCCAVPAARDEPEPSGPSLARQSGLESAHGSSESEAIRPSSRTPVAPELAFPSPSPETSSHSSHQHTAGRKQSLPSSLLDTSSPSTSGPTYSSSPDPEDRVPSRRAGPGRRRSSSRQQGKAVPPSKVGPRVPVSGPGVAVTGAVG